MKSIQKGLLALLVVTGISANAVHIPGTRVPEVIRLQEFDAQGNEINAQLRKSLNVTRNEDQEIDRVLFTEQEIVFCVTAPCPPMNSTTEFYVTNVREDGCGSQIYQLNAVAHDSFQEYRALEIADHTFRRCEDFKPYTFELDLTQGSTVRHFSGNRIPVYTIQGR